MDESQKKDEQPAEQSQKPQKERTKLKACLDCIKNGISTGLKDAETLCPTCRGSGSVKAVV